MLTEHPTGAAFGDAQLVTNPVDAQPATGGA